MRRISFGLSDGPAGGGTGIRNRIPEIDIAKALGILLMLIGHRTNGFIRDYIYLFHMPMFFVLSGCVMKDRDYSLSGSLKSESRLFSYYAVYSAIFVLYCLATRFDMRMTLEEVLKTVTMFGIDVLWFVSTLWLAKLAVRSLCRIRDRILRVIAVVSIYTLSYFVSGKVTSIRYHGIVMKGIVLLSGYIARTGVVLVFVYLGYALKRHIFEMLSYLGRHTITAAAAMLVCGAVIVPFAKSNAIDYHVLRNGSYALNVIYGSVGTVGVLSAAALAGHLPGWVKCFLLFVGKSSIHFMTSEYFGVTKILNGFIVKNVGDIPYMKFIIFVPYFVLLCFFIRKAGPLIDRTIGKCGKLIDTAIDKLSAPQEARSL